MSAVVTPTSDEAIGESVHLYEGTIALDNSYPTGGYAIDVPNNARITTMVCGAAGGYTFHFIASTQKLKVYRGDNTNAAAAPGVEVSNAVDLSAVPAVPYIAMGA